jgi:lipopolysaccharide cholinephosphotransferase
MRRCLRYLCSGDERAVWAAINEIECATNLRSSHAVVSELKASIRRALSDCAADSGGFYLPSHQNAAVRACQILRALPGGDTDGIPDAHTLYVALAKRHNEQILVKARKPSLALEKTILKALALDGCEQAAMNKAMRGLPVHLRSPEAVNMITAFVSVPQEGQLLLFEVLSRAAALLNHHKIPFWICSGTLLGHRRHLLGLHPSSLIPWDDDVDVCISREHESALRNLFLDEVSGQERPRAGLVLEHVPMFGFKLFAERVEPGEWTQWAKVMQHNGAMRHGAFVDVFVVSDAGPDEPNAPRQLDRPLARATWPREQFLNDELLPLRSAVFHGSAGRCCNVWTPSLPETYLERLYGAECRSVAVVPQDLHGRRLPCQLSFPLTR